MLTTTDNKLLKTGKSGAKHIITSDELIYELRHKLLFYKFYFGIRQKHTKSNLSN